MKKMKILKGNAGLFIFLFLGILLSGIIFATAPSFHTSGTTSYLSENQQNLFSYNFSANLTNPDNVSITYTIEEIKSSLYPAQNTSAFYYWINLSSSSGVMTINSTYDNQTGRFNVSVHAVDPTPEGPTNVFYFIVNATNDAPVFTGINSQYNLTQAQNFSQYINASDEESHYPLIFSINFTSCTLANWSVRTNCTLLNFLSPSNNSVLMNYTPGNNDVGTYFANISVMDSGVNYNCSSGYCLTNYSQNKTTYYSSLVTFNVFTTLGVNYSNCENKIFQENQTGICYINITATGSSDVLNISSIASVRNYAASASNTSWFYPLNLTAAVNFQKVILINVTPQKTEIGNWTINFSVSDLTSLETSISSIHVYVNKTLDDTPSFVPISNKNTSINLLTRINITVYDNDLLIPDKVDGYNETINFTLQIFNQSDLSQGQNISNFTIQILNNPVSGTNRTEAKIQFTPNSSDSGNYAINITATDRGNRRSSVLFNFSIISNNAPTWNSSMQTVFILYENNLTYLNLSSNVTDSDGNALTFSFTNDTEFSSFNINVSTGIVNFTPVDVDIGQHLVTIIASDGYLTGSAVLNFTIYNVNDALSIERPISAGDSNSSVDANSNINTQEDNYTIIWVWVRDNDFKIPVAQRGFYYENFTVNLTIQGLNSTLFSLAKDLSWPPESFTGANRTKYNILFTPKKADVGNYNVTINISDASGASDFLRINLTIVSVEHSPVLMNLSNWSSAVNRSFNYRINATDSEDGSSTLAGNTNLTFNYTFLSGADFIRNNQSIFNFSTGILNITFNSSQGGSYNLNISVNDTSGRRDSKNFWIYVYDAPVVNYPLASNQYILAENQTYNFTFSVNHSVGNNLSYIVYLESGNITSVLYNQSYYGNSSNLSFQFTPNFTQETTANKNITLIVYPADESLQTRISVNTTQRWNITINHTNSPLSFSGTIGGSSQRISGSSPQQIILSDYFSDIDASDALRNQTIGFVYNMSATSGGSISVAIQNWTNGITPVINFSATSAASANFTLTAYEYNESNSSQIIRNATSNNFSVEITVSTTTISTPSSGGGGGNLVPVAFRLTAPETVDLSPYQKITVPISIKNKGDQTFYTIKLSSSAFKDGSLTSELESILDLTKIESFSAKQTKNFSVSLTLNTNNTKEYEVVISAVSESPKYDDSVKIKINHRNLNKTEIEKYILFTEEFLVQNPECIELKEILDEAKNYFNNGDFGNARAKTEKVLDACKEFISQASLPTMALPFKYDFNTLLIFATAGAIILGISYYSLSKKKFSSLDNFKVKRTKRNV